MTKFMQRLGNDDWPEPEDKIFEEIKIETKHCKTCGEEKPLTEFYTFKLKDDRVGYRAECKACSIIKQRERQVASENHVQEKKKTKPPKKQCAMCQKVRFLKSFPTPESSICKKCVAIIKKRQQADVVRRLTAGDRVLIKFAGRGHGTRSGERIIGEVVSTHKNFFVLRNNNGYRESFMFADVACGMIKVVER